MYKFVRSPGRFRMYKFFTFSGRIQCVQICTFSGKILSVQICMFSGNIQSVQICTLPAQFRMYKFVHCLHNSECTNLYIVGCLTYHAFLPLPCEQQSILRLIFLTSFLLQLRMCILLEYCQWPLLGIWRHLFQLLYTRIQEVCPFLPGLIRQPSLPLWHIKPKLVDILLLSRWYRD